MWIQPLLLVLAALVFGVIGSRWIARHRRGVRAAASYLLLTVVPYGGMMAMIAVNTDPTLSQRQAQYNGEFAFALFVIAFTIPWIIACVIGAWLGRRHPSATTGPASSTAASAVPRTAPAPVSTTARPDNLPEWTRADSPRLTLGQLDARICEIASRHGFAPERLPASHSPPGGEGTFIAEQKFDYIYGYVERGQLIDSFPSVIADEICYKVFYDLSFSDATNIRARAPDPQLEYLVQVRREQEAILARIDPRWAAQARFERALKDAAAH